MCFDGRAAQTQAGPLMTIGTGTSVSLHLSNVNGPLFVRRTQTRWQWTGKVWVRVRMAKLVHFGGQRWRTVVTPKYGRLRVSSSLLGGKLRRKWRWGLVGGRHDRLSVAPHTRPWASSDIGVVSPLLIADLDSFVFFSRFTSRAATSAVVGRVLGVIARFS